MRKQQLKKIDIWQILSEQGVQISYQTVCRYVTDKEKATRAAQKPMCARLTLPVRSASSTGGR